MKNVTAVAIVFSGALLAPSQAFAECVVSELDYSCTGLTCRIDGNATFDSLNKDDGIDFTVTMWAFQDDGSGKIRKRYKYKSENQELSDGDINRGSKRVFMNVSFQEFAFMGKNEIDSIEFSVANCG